MRTRCLLVASADNLAMQHLGLKEGSIITLNQSDTFESDDKTIRMIPATENLNKKLKSGCAE